MGHLRVGLDFSFLVVLPSGKDNQTHMFVMEWKIGRRWVLNFNSVESTLCVCVCV